MGNYLVPSGRGGYMIRKNSGAMVINESELNRMIDEGIRDRLKDFFYSKNGFRNQGLDKRQLQKSKEYFIDSQRNLRSELISRMNMLNGAFVRLLNSALVQSYEDLYDLFEKYYKYFKQSGEDIYHGGNAVETISKLERFCRKFEDFLNQIKDEYYYEDSDYVRRYIKVRETWHRSDNSIRDRVKESFDAFNDIVRVVQDILNNPITYRD